ncbi:MAG TPA: hypothetical protein VIJ94_13075 [Caulobacteraceae bacterium]
MDDQDWINLQQLVGRGPQPSFLDPGTPDHILYANALAAYGGGQPQGRGPTPYQLALADALDAYGKQTPAAPDRPVDPFDGLSGGASRANPQLVSYREPGAAGAGRPAPDTGAQYAMGSPAEVDLPWQEMADQYTTPSPKPAPPPPVAPLPTQTTIDPIPGYDQTGDNAWRAANDQTFLDAVNRYNAANGYRPGDPGYWTADMLKAQAMQESGGSRRAFSTDPLQVNAGDWDDKKRTLSGLEPGQAMTPQTSAGAALKWLQYKGWLRDGTGKAYRYLGDESALQRYNTHPGYGAKVEALDNAASSIQRPGK